MPDEKLFRQEALDELTKRSYGEPIAYLPRLWPIVGAFVFILVIVSATYLMNATYARKERVTGWLVPNLGVVKLSAPQLSQIHQIFVKEGDLVNKGDILFTLVLDQETAYGERTTNNILRGVKREREQLKIQEGIVGYSAEIKINSLQNQLKLLEEEKALLAEQILAQRKLVKIAEGILSRMSSLGGENILSQLDIERQNEILVRQGQKLLELRERDSQTSRQIEEMSVQVQNVPISTNQRISELESSQARLSQREEELKSKGKVIISSPINGQISNVNGKEGNIVSPSVILASILPEGVELYAQIFVRSQAIGFIEKSQDVKLMYAAYPHQRFGFGEGKVLSISRTILNPEELPNAIGLKEPAYKVHVRLESQSITAFDKELYLKPGMLLTAEIIQEDRSFLQWFLEPLYAKRGN